MVVTEGIGTRKEDASLSEQQDSGNHIGPFRPTNIGLVV